MADTDPEPHGYLELAAEIAAAIVLAAAAFLTSWASFQAALWDGEQAASYTRAGAARVEAGQLATRNGQSEAADLFLFSQWLDAYARGEEKLQHFYRVRFRPEFATAFEAWLKRKPGVDPNAPPTPFAMHDYVPRFAKAARDMEVRADALFGEGQRDNETSDAFVQATVIFALALFLAGIGQTFKRAHFRAILSGIGAAACVLGAIKLFALPMLSL